MEETTIQMKTNVCLYLGRQATLCMLVMITRGVSVRHGETEKLTVHRLMAQIEETVEMVTMMATMEEMETTMAPITEMAGTTMMEKTTMMINPIITIQFKTCLPPL